MRQQSMSFAGASPARTSAEQAAGVDSADSAAGSGTRCSASSSSRTSRAASVDGCPTCGTTSCPLGTAPRLGPLERVMWAPLTAGCASSSSAGAWATPTDALLPTPTASAATRGWACRGQHAQGGPSLGESVLWPTATAQDVAASGSRVGNPQTKAHPGTSLTDAAVRQAHWPTPSATSHGTSNNGCPRDGRTEYATRGKASLETLARREWGTPTSHDRTHTPRAVHHGKQLANDVGAQLNPDWVEVLMGFPEGWTDAPLLPRGAGRRGAVKRSTTGNRREWSSGRRVDEAGAPTTRRRTGAHG